MVIGLIWLLLLLLVERSLNQNEQNMKPTKYCDNCMETLDDLLYGLQRKKKPRQVNVYLAKHQNNTGLRQLNKVPVESNTLNNTELKQMISQGQLHLNNNVVLNKFTRDINQFQDQMIKGVLNQLDKDIIKDNLRQSVLNRNRKNVDRYQNMLKNHFQLP